MIIRRATQNDDLVGIWREVYEADHIPLLPPGVHAPFEPRGEPHVAEVGAAAVGFCYVDNDWLDELWVGKRWQNRGIGTALIRHAEMLMRSRGILQGSLSVLASNSRAIALYRRLGWSEVRRFVSSRNGQIYLRMAKLL